MSKNSLTANQAAVIDAIAEGFFCTEEEGFSGLFDTFAAGLADRGTLKDKKTAKVVINQLLKKRILHVDDEMLTLTESGKYAITEIQAEDANEASLASAEAAGEYTGHAATFEAEEAPEEEEEDLLGDTGEIPVVEAPAEPAKEDTLTVTDAYTVREWEEDGKEAPTEWIETTFKDGSKTLRRRTKVSGAWRTDYWGWEAGSDKKLFTSAKACKMARAYGTFTTAI